MKKPSSEIHQFNKFNARKLKETQIIGKRSCGWYIIEAVGVLENIYSTPQCLRILKVLCEIQLQIII